VSQALISTSNHQHIIDSNLGYGCIIYYFKIFVEAIKYIKPHNR